MKQNPEEWRFMRLRAEQLYEEGDVRRALRMMRLINRAQEERFAALLSENGEEQEQKVVSTH